MDLSSLDGDQSLRDADDQTPHLVILGPPNQLSCGLVMRLPDASTMPCFDLPLAPENLPLAATARGRSLSGETLHPSLCVREMKARFRTDRSS
jgi:hypothetical protein